MVGQAGIEYQHNRLLMGHNGMRRVVVNSRGVEVAEAELVAPVDGPMVHLTIDLDVQAAMEEAMQGKSGSVVALDPETGEILGLRLEPGLRPEPVRDRHRQRRLEDPDRRPADAAREPRHPGPVPGGQHVQDRDRAGGAAGRRDHAEHALLLPGLPERLRHHAALPQGGRPRHGRPAPGDRGLVQRLLLPRGREARDRPHRPVREPARPGPAQRHRPAERDGRAHPEHRVEAARAEDRVVPGRDGLGRDRPGPGAGDADADGAPRGRDRERRPPGEAAPAEVGARRARRVAADRARRPGPEAARPRRPCARA